MILYNRLELAGALPDSAKNAVVFDATAIAKAIDAMPDGVVHEYDYGMVAPPFTERPFWVEATTEIAGDTVTRAALCVARDAGDSAFEAARSKSAARWAIEVSGIVEVSGTINPVSGLALILVDARGYLVFSPEKTRVMTDSSLSEARRESSGFVLANMVPFVLMSIGFLHKRTEVKIERPSRAEIRRENRIMTGKRGGSSVKERYVIKVNAHKSPANDDVDYIEPVRGSKRGEQRTAHGVRGHFRWIGSGGLFGKGYHADQMLWVPDHVRGVGQAGRPTYLLVED